MAQAFALMHARPDNRIYSAGSKAIGQVNPKAIAAMKRRGYDMSEHSSDSFESLPEIEWDHIVGMGCGDACSFLPAKEHHEWDIPDPKNLNPSEFDLVRDSIERSVLQLLLKHGLT
jgi:protein-tyrosine-phosphatase